MSLCKCVKPPNLLNMNILSPIYIAQPVSKRRAPCGIHYDSNVLLFCEENYAILHFP